MPTFVYSARDQQGLVQTGHLDAASEDDVVNVLQHRGLIVTSVAPKDGVPEVKQQVATRSRPRRMHGRILTDDHVLLCQQLATMVEAGVPLLRSLEVVSAQVESRRLLIALDAVRRDVAAGSTFREALAKHPQVFSAMWLNLIETGEASGHLADSLQQLARHFELAQRLQNEAKTALTYPAFLALAAAGVTALFVYWLIPKFAVMFASMEGLELPLLTRIVIGVSEIAKKQFLVLIGAGALSFYLGRYYLATSNGQWVRDQFMLQVPLFKTLFTYLQLAEFSRGLATLLGSGVPLLSCLEILERSATNKVYGKAIGEVRTHVQEGKPMAQPMMETGLFPPIAVQLVLVGEEVGELVKMTGRMAKYYEERVETFISRMTRLFEPIAIVVMGVLVLIIVLSIFMPLFNMASGGKIG